MNKSLSERIAGFLESKGWKKAKEPNKADFLFVNMCSVRQSAVDRVYGLIPKIKKIKLKNQKLKTVLTGCILLKDRKNFSEWFDFILPIETLPKWDLILKRKPKDPFLYFDTVKKNYAGNYLKITPKYTSKISAFLPIMTGCNNFCSYCVIPYTRGPEISRPVNEIIKEVKDLVKKGYKEIWLLGQNVANYSSTLKKQGKTTKIDFARLLELINNIPGKFWIRFTSPNPENFSDKLINTIAKCEKVTEYLNLPVQAGDDEILKKMNRKYTISQYKQLVKKIRKKIPNISLSTDVIVGFPGETKKQFEKTAKLFREIKYDLAYIAKYSPRPQTSAFRLEDNVPEEEKKRREKVLTEILRKTAFSNNKKYLQKEVEVLVEKHIENNKWQGKTRTFKTVVFESNLKDLLGKFVIVKIKKVLPFGLSGELIKICTENKKN